MNKLIDNSIFSVAAALVLSVPFLAVAQTPQTPPVPKAVTVQTTPAVAPVSRISVNRVRSLNAVEQSIKVDGSVNLTLNCVLEGAIKVNGWNRNEVRVFVESGKKFAFRTLEKSEKTGEPVWIKLIGVDVADKYGASSDCISGSEIEIDAPVNSTITVKGREISTSIDRVKRVDVETIGGDVSVKNISGGVRVVSRQGDITVDASKGAMILDTTTGNILVFDAGPSEIGDVFKARTSSGAVALQRLQFRQVNVDSVTGSVAYIGDILSGGSYNMRTSKGSLRLTIPVNSSFEMWATYGFGSFATEIPVDITTENIAGPLKTIRGQSGAGGATVKLTTNNGSIGIKKP